MDVLLRRHGGDGGATAVLVRCHGGHGGAAATPLRVGPNRGGTAEVLNMFNVSSVSSRRSAVLIVFCGATAIYGGTTAEPRRSWRNRGDHGGATTVYTVQAPQWHRASGVTGVVLRRHGGTCSKCPAVTPRRAAVLTVFRGATAINEGTTAEPRRSWRCNCGSCRTSTAVASHVRCDGGITVCTICLVRVRAETKTITSQEKRLVGVYVRKEQTGTHICVTCSTALERTSTFQLNEQITTHCTVYSLVTTMQRCSIPCVFRLRLDQQRITRQP